MNPSWKSILEEYGGLFKETGRDVTRAHRFSILVDAYKDFQRVTLVCYQGFLWERQVESAYWLQKQKEEKL